MNMLFSLFKLKTLSCDFFYSSIQNKKSESFINAAQHHSDIPYFDSFFQSTELDCPNF